MRTEGAGASARGEPTLPHVPVADDDPGVLEVTSYILGSAGHEVTATAVVQEGLGDMGRGSPDTVVTMPSRTRPNPEEGIPWT